MTRPTPAPRKPAPGVLTRAPVQLHEVYEDRKQLVVVMELCTGGDLHTYITNKEVQISENHARAIM